MKEDFVCFLDVLRTILKPCSEALGRNQYEPVSFLCLSYNPICLERNVT
jgi:hypothetical protein